MVLIVGFYLVLATIMPNPTSVQFCARSCEVASLILLLVQSTKDGVGAVSTNAALSLGSSVLILGCIKLLLIIAIVSASNLTRSSIGDIYLDYTLILVGHSITN